MHINCVFERFITARKRSFGQGNVFLHLCVILFKGGRGGFPVCITGNMTGGSATRGVCPTGCTPPPGLQDTVNKRAVRILLECILIPHLLKVTVALGISRTYILFLRQIPVHGYLNICCLRLFNFVSYCCKPNFVFHEIFIHTSVSYKSKFTASNNGDNIRYKGDFLDPM